MMSPCLLCLISLHLLIICQMSASHIKPFLHAAVGKYFEAEGNVVDVWYLLKRIQSLLEK
jgi:hypothetical protein